MKPQKSGRAAHPHWADVTTEALRPQTTQRVKQTNAIGRLEARVVSDKAAIAGLIVIPLD